MILNITAYFIIPVYTFLFAWGTDWFTLNFSVLGSLANRKNAFLLWGIIVGTYFYYVLRKIIHHLPRNRKETVTSVSALILLAFAVTTPYLPENRPFRAFLHVIFAFSASVLLGCLYLIVWKLYCMNRDGYRSYFICLNVITVLSAMLLLLAGIVSSALEIFFTVSCTLMLIRLYRRVSSAGDTYYSLKH
ncbi:hypothetical protein [Hungatella hathewayi]|mgnify:FL=1|uniref:hypothetical protein n=1 Tax=Hungatella hathewayi TaxID=154046 RepID=UPI00321AFD41